MHFYLIISILICQSRIGIEGNVKLGLEERGYLGQYAINAKNAVINAANYIGKNVINRAENYEEKMESIFREMATFQDFVMFTVNGLNGRPFLLKNYLDFHSNYHFELLLEKTFYSSKKEKSKERSEALENEINNSMNFEHLSMEEATEWRIQFIDWQDKFRKYPFWFKLRQNLTFKDRMENQIIKFYQGLIASKVEKHDLEYPPEILKHLMEAEKDFDQIHWDIKNSAEMIEKQRNLWKEKIEPFLGELEKIKNEILKEKWNFLKEMNDAITHDLRFKVNGLLRVTEMNMERQKESIEKKYRKYLVEMEKRAKKAKEERAEEAEQNESLHQLNILTF